MTSPFSNGSRITDLPRQPQSTPLRPDDPYWRQVYANAARDEADWQRGMERTRLLERGRALAGFIQRDRRHQGEGFVWQLVQTAAWPAQMPAGMVQTVDTAIAAERTARAGLAAAEQQYALWFQDHPTSPPERQIAKHAELTEDLLPVAQRAAAQVEQVLTHAAAVVEAIERWQEAEQAAPVKRAAVDRAHEQALATIETDVMAARTAAQRLGVAV